MKHVLKKLTLIFPLVLLSTLLYSQGSYSLNLGNTQSFYSERLTSETEDMHLKNGFQLGATVHIDLLKQLKFRSSLQLTQKGLKTFNGSLDSPEYQERKISTTYFEMPLSVIYSIPVTQVVNLFIGAGPVLSFGLFGKSKSIIKGIDSTGQLSTRSYSSTDLFDEKPGYKRFDFGVDFLTGIQFKKIIITVNYNHGLVDIIKDDLGAQHTKNRSFCLSLGYILTCK